MLVRIRVRVPSTVIHSLMPKGVEHAVMWAWRDTTAAVIHSLMPKGVEHQPPAP